MEMMDVVHPKPAATDAPGHGPFGMIDTTVTQSSSRGSSTYLRSFLAWQEEEEREAEQRRLAEAAAPTPDSGLVERWLLGEEARRAEAEEDRRRRLMEWALGQEREQEERERAEEEAAKAPCATETLDPHDMSTTQYRGWLSTLR